jgi:hypothetical protein
VSDLLGFGFEGWCIDACRVGMLLCACVGLVPACAYEAFLWALAIVQTFSNL